MNLDHLRVLLLDDNPHDRQLTLRELQKQFPAVRANEPIDDRQFRQALAETDLRLVITDYQLRWTNGIEAIETARGYAPEPVLLDIGMPRIDGYEVCRLIRQEPWGIRTAIVALTGWGQEADRRGTSETGFDAHLVKPVHPDSAVKLLSELLTSRGPG